MRLGETIRDLRTAKKLSQNELAELLEVSRQSVSKWETDGAVPDLDKLVRMSELFGVTLDTLVKGPEPTEKPTNTEPTTAQPPTDSSPSAETRPVACSPFHRIAGIILLCFGGFILVALGLLMGYMGSALLYAAPFLLCSLLCLRTRRRTGLWCAWAVFFCADFYLRYATGISWQIILSTPHFTPEMNFVRLYIGWGQFLYIAALLACTLRAYRTWTLTRKRRHVVRVLALWALYAALWAGESLALGQLHRMPQQALEAVYLWLRFGVGTVRLMLLSFLLNASAALLRRRKEP